MPKRSRPDGKPLLRFDASDIKRLRKLKWRVQTTSARRNYDQDVYAQVFADCTFHVYHDTSLVIQDRTPTLTFAMAKAHDEALLLVGRVLRHELSYRMKHNGRKPPLEGERKPVKLRRVVAFSGADVSAMAKAGWNVGVRRAHFRLSRRVTAYVAAFDGVAGWFEVKQDGQIIASGRCDTVLIAAGHAEHQALSRIAETTTIAHAYRREGRGPSTIRLDGKLIERRDPDDYCERKRRVRLSKPLP